MADSDDCTAGSIDLESHVLLNEGFTIETQDGIMGRLAVTTKPMEKLYEVVFRERPLLSWKVGDMEDFLLRFESASTETRNKILDMYHPPLDADASSAPAIFLKLKSMAATLAGSTGIDVPLVHKLLAICANNAHQYSSGGEEQSAIFAYASKMSHSCSPNLAYSSIQEDNQGALEYRLIRSIPSGQPAAFSYIGGGRLLYQTPTNKRREKLLQTKSFWCRCARCSGPDYCRSIRCTSCHNEQLVFVPCIYQDDGKNDSEQKRNCKPRWICPCCGVLDAEDMQLKEEELAGRLESLKPQDQPQDNIEQLQALIQESKDLLSPVHYLTVEALETLMQWSASKAKTIEKSTSSALVKKAKKAAASKIAADACLQVVVACECIAAGCSGCFDSSQLTCKQAGNFVFPHEPIYEMGPQAFQASIHLVEVPEKLRFLPTVAMIERYLPIMKAITADLKPGSNSKLVF